MCLVSCSLDNCYFYTAWCLHEKDKYGVNVKIGEYVQTWLKLNVRILRNSKPHKIYVYLILVYKGNKYQ